MQYHFNLVPYITLTLYTFLHLDKFKVNIITSEYSFRIPRIQIDLKLYAILTRNNTGYLELVYLISFYIYLDTHYL